MAFSYTEQQQSVIDVRDRNVLVSAAAGSGKTAVLVERVIRMLLQGEIQMDELLVVTFTRAAASEMRERISDALNHTLREDFRQEIREQLALLPSADITTIHSFCLKMIRENYTVLGLEPDFRIGDEAEVEILSEEAMEELLEAEYEKAEPEFLHFARSFASGTSDEPVENMIRRLYTAAQGMPVPKEWLELAIIRLEAETPADLRHTALFQMLWQEITEKCKEAERVWTELADITDTKEFAAFQEQVAYFGELIKVCRKCLNDQDFDGIYQLLRTYHQPAMPRTRKGIEPEILAEAKHKIENLRSFFEEIQPYFRNDLAENWEITRNMQRIVRELKRLVIAYAEGFQEKKQMRGMIDFNDIEHMALELLQDENGERTEVAERYRSRFKQVIIDEYQDTNEVQERILELVSGAPESPNSFMVGDIKQSIYKFRLAKPEIFQEKYRNYGDLTSDYAKIDMQTNFRSRQEVLKLVNYVFRSIMTQEAAGIDYDERAKFVFLNEQPAEEKYCPKLLLIEKDSYQDEEEIVDRETLEAETIAAKIVEMLDQNRVVYDKKEGVYRPIRVEDIAILMRSPSKAMSVYAEVFQRYGLPILTAEGKAYFMTSEVKTLIDFLKIIDNPRDDLALLGVLCSAIFVFTPADLAEIRIQTEKNEFFYDSIIQYYHKFQIEGDRWDLSMQTMDTWQKTAFFLKELAVVKEAAYTLTISRLIALILERSRYVILIAMQPNGKQRSLNVNAFVEQIRLFEEKEKSGLFHFLKRLEKIKSLDLSFGEPVMEVSKAVRIMSIHKSKGLEFPAVFLAQLGKAFNIRDVSAPIVIKDVYGVIVSDVDYKNRVIREGFQKPILKTILRREILEEEQRLLYVALTRAREYLYLVGTVNSSEKALQKWEMAIETGKNYVIDGFTGQIRSREYLLSARSYLDFMMPALLGAAEQGLVEIEQMYGGNEEERVSETEVLSEEEGIAEGLIERLRNFPMNEEDTIPFYPDYPYPEFIQEKITTSVSEEKRRFLPEENFVGENGTVQAGIASIRGSLYHKILATLPWEIEESDLPSFLQSFVEQKKMTAQELTMIDIDSISGVLRSELWQRMKAAAEKGKIKREQPFILAIPLRSGDIMEPKMLQGVIDVFFEEDGELVLVDYKTDQLFGNKKQAEKTLKERYAYQMQSYRRALETITELPVKQVYLYSVSRQMPVLFEQKGE